MFFSNIFYGKIIDNECEYGRPRDVFPETRGVSALVVAVFAQTFSKKIIGETASLGEAVHAFVDANVDSAVMYNVFEFVLGYDLWWD